MSKNLRAIMMDSGTYGAHIKSVPVRNIVNTPNIPSKVEREFDLKVGRADSEFGRHIKVKARSSLEAGLIIIIDDLIPHGYVAHSLVDPLAGA